jgi:pantoate--beta-alanine ligase
MVADFNLPVTLRVLPTIREDDGLALSSRNVYLTPEARAASTILYRALLAGQEIFDGTPIDDPAGVPRVRACMEKVIAAEPRARLDYAEVRDPLTFLPLQRPQTPALLLIAATVEGTRLIDNFLLCPDGSWEKGRQLS